ncbi:twin-arginine translocase subunit TatC [Streptomyces abyssomicinicus]|uniref:twin-arginine translocase subunit TatC n=1 Tax=Streptomyces abyssomicinicus TaxID=574929 RepID=UPI00125047E3|nr:twin-arginine translocase subunit TatC [Streptomyces abyssomicinicus]
MPLMEHLRELRRRVSKAVVAIVVVTIGAVFFSEQLMDFLAAPVPICEGGFAQSKGGNCAVLSFNTLTSPFTVTVKVSLMAGLIIASPVWLYQLWAFVAPGLHQHERKYTYAFVAAAVPLFVGGAALAYVVLPVSVQVLLSLTPDVASNMLTLDDVLDFTVRMVLIFGLAFELPLLLIMLNMVGVVTGKRMASWWRGVVMGVFVFGAVATPTTDPVGMIALSGPIVVLFFLAVGFSILNDKRRARKNKDTALSDDEASEVDLTPESIEEVEPVATAPMLPEQADGGRTDRQGRINGYDDVT